MYNSSEIRIFNTEVEPANSGSKIFNQSDGIINIDDLRKSLEDDSTLVVIRNHVKEWSVATEIQSFINTGRLIPEEGYECTFVFAHYGHTLDAVTNRKIIMSFEGKGNDAVLKASYFSS